MSWEGGGSESVGTFLQSGGAGGAAVWGGDVGDHPEDGSVPGYFPAQGHVMAHQEAAEDTDGLELGLPTIAGGNGGSRL